MLAPPISTIPRIKMRYCFFALGFFPDHFFKTAKYPDLFENVKPFFSLPTLWDFVFAFARASDGGEISEFPPEKCSV